MKRCLVLLLAASYANAQCDGLDMTTCTGSNACLWSPPWKAGTCQPDPCSSQGTVATCEAVEVEVTPCPSPLPDPDYCMFSPCLWDGRCEPRPCLHRDQLACESATGCAWRPPAGGVPTGPLQAVVDVCHEELCAHLDMFACFGRQGCTHDFANGCHTEGCAEHDNEATCDQDVTCKWDGAQKLPCVDHPCSKKSGTLCTKASECMWKDSNCVSKTCNKYNDPNDKCACEEDPDCKWHADATHPHCVDPKFNECPDLDIAMVLDGSGSMSKKFGDHRHGFHAMMEIMRAWVRTLPLTGDDHTAGADAARGTGEFRVTFIQFSKANALPSEDHPTGCGVGQCTDGLLSGRLDELEGDITWHERNYQGQWTYIHEALKDVADHTFLPAQSPSWRQHVVIIVADGGLTDFDGDSCCDDVIGCGNPRCVDTTTFDASFPGKLAATQQQLRDEEVTVYGVVIRRSKDHNALDASAANKLKVIISDPRDEHFINIMIDELPDRVLNSLCDPVSKFGRQVTSGGMPTGCSAKAAQDECEANEACAWDVNQLPKCHDDPCYPLCNEQTCVRNALCQWMGDKCELKPPTCESFGTPAECEAAGHLWDPIWSATNGCECDPCKDHAAEFDCKAQQVTMPAPCQPPFGQPDYCKLAVCAWDAATNTCGGEKCLKVDQATCETEPACLWTAAAPVPDQPTKMVAQCGRPICTDTTAGTCTTDPRCLWNTCSSTCTTKVCYTAHTTNEGLCRGDVRCAWAAGVPTAAGMCDNVPCMNFMATEPCDCAQDPQCMPVGSPDGCIAATPAPPTPVPDTDAPATDVPDTDAPPTDAPATAAPATNAPPTDAPPTDAPATDAPATDAPPTNAPPTEAPIPETPVPVPRLPPAVDECRDVAKADVCAAAGQVCQDPDTSVADNFVCKCQPPATATNAGAAVAACPYDECTEHETTCTAVGQTCRDTDLLALDTWVCECIDPQEPVPAGSVGNQQPAACRDPPGDCEAHGRICTAAGQHCVDGTAGDDQITCECLPPAKGTAGQQAPAACVLDECVETCPHCAQSAGSANVCTEAGQTCEDPKKDPLSTSDWRCVCAPPTTGSKLIAAADDCELNECVAACPTCADSGAGNVCQLAGQTCVEHSLTRTGDWECHCIAPANGIALAQRVAACEEDECRTQEKVCTDAGQTCVDASKTTSGDWTCVCPPPSASVGQQVAAAVCEADECRAGDVAQQTCAAANQVCVDNDKSALNNWECHCRAPGTGVHVLGPVDHCELDECAVQCATCANADGRGNVCELHGQTCEDPRTTTSSLSDWQCRCPTPSTATALTAAVGSCGPTKDECVEGPSTAVQACVHTPRYTNEGCLCKCGWEARFTCTGTCLTTPGRSGPGTIGSPCTAGCCNPDGEASDWCYVDGGDPYNQAKPACVAQSHGFCTAAGTKPVDGGKVLRVPIPGVPAGQNNVCTDAGQKCVDPDTSTDGDWVCECVLPLTGPQGAQAPTACDEDECTVHAGACGPDQVCRDEDKQTRGTWVCECAPPSAANATQGGPTTCELDECVAACPTCAVDGNGRNVCGAVGQTCEDPDQTTTSLSDWTCTCRPPSTESAVGAPASCTLDECAVVCPTCADNGSGQNLCLANDQLCEDANPSPDHVSDWTCSCKPPFTDVQTASLALCERDECEDHAATCTAGQQCIDPSLVKTGDWYCECLPPSTGMQVGGAVAACHVDECKDKANVCAAAGQHCVDADVAATGDWICECIAPDVGTPGMQAASTTCQPPDACRDHGDVCSAVRQHCTNGDAGAGTWACECIPPATGTPTQGGPTVCETDECVAICATCQQTTGAAHPVCAMQGQECVDPDKTTMSNWECRCAPPTTGTAAVMQPAVCELDECAAACATCAGTTCTGAEQTCEEGVKTLRHLSDWHCVCPPPSTNKARAAAAADCSYSECDAAENLRVCTGADQICVDPDTHTTGNWECHCKPPASGSAAGAAAGGCDVINECATVCATCANTGGGNECQKAGQRCVDASHTTTGDWYCECVVGHGIAVGSVVPRCELDECVDVCPTCAKQNATARNICEHEGQTCVDPVQDTLAVGNWRCVCPPPLQHIVQGTGVAVCGVDECKDRVNGAVPGSVCTQAGQLCSDAKPDTLGDFVCSCPPPSSGVHTGGPVALCTLDECRLHGEVCANASQTCLDPNPTAVNDWVCECPPPSSTVQLRGVATCEVDECRTKADLCSPMQDCVDPDRTVGGDIECRCRAPATGSAMNGPASCILDECAADCATCAKRRCEGGAQTCEDPVTTTTSLSDWRCKCAAPSIAYAVGNVAECPVDECVEFGHVCRTANQTCADPNHAAERTGDWECKCAPPTTGSALGQAATTCHRDECLEHGHVCTDRGQTCFDPVKLPGTLGDWECHCMPPATQVATGAAAVCQLVGECDDPTISDVCTSAGQSCVDPSVTTMNDWMCECVSPSTGATQLRGAAECQLDECRADCGTCAHGACARANQECVDTNLDPVTGLSTWECRCVAPQSGSEALAPAECTVDECALYGSTCTAADQDCQDPDAATRSDWLCVCRAPGVGQATGAAAGCVTDECLVHGKKCTDAGQTCFDVNKAAEKLGDWECRCTEPGVGSAVGRPVVPCEVDECKLHGDVCTNAGQTCVDDEKEIDGFWFCVCRDGRTRGDQGVADCVFDECVETGNTTAVPVAGQDNVCAQAGQTCLDADTKPGSLQDWACTCPAPNADTSAVAAVANCAVDECVARADVCTGGQRCVDPDWGQEGDFACVCPPPSTGNATGAAAVECLLDECFENAQVCRDRVQVCEDADKTTANTWVCKCPAHAPVVNSTLMAPTGCTPPAESECLIPAIAAICAAKGQLCVDARLATKNDWTCECVAPARGTAVTGGAATCVLDECEEDCNTCAHVTCAAAGQTCVDPDTDAQAVRDWECRCVAPRSGTGVAAVAECLLDECNTVCTSCADHGAGNACLLHDQTCVDPNTDARSTSDWVCVCKPAHLGNATVGIARCVVDECEEYGPLVCQADQVCNDPDTAPDSLGDWTCTCPPPAEGSATAMRAHCTLNECHTQDNHLACEEAGQICIDPQPLPDSLENWECHCPQGAVAAVKGPAECTLDECTETCATCADTGGGNRCAVAGQACADPNTAVERTGDWTCTCAAGAPSAVANVAVCQLDECTMPGNYAAHTCEETGRTTAAEGCTCQCNWVITSGLAATASGPGLDTPCKAGCCNPDRRAGGDWCLVEDTPENRAKGCRPLVPLVCAGVPSAPAGAAPAAAVVNACTRGGQVCVDRDTSAGSQGDWRCECALPATGAPQATGLATCEVDECRTKFAVCEAEGQTCRDGPGTGDWECVCPPPATGSLAGGVAACTYVGECETEANARVCTQVGQTCFDPRPAVDGDWVCRCVEPAAGVSTAGAPAVCKLDECTAKCATCADSGFGNVCAAAGQTCLEGSKSSDDPSDWQCVCSEGQFGQALTAVAVCRVDECLLNHGQFADLCGADGQTCFDPNTNATGGLGDWQCVCPPPREGAATGGLALCGEDECQVPEHLQACTHAGQRCVDPNQRGGSLGNWECVCIEDETLRAVGQAADCHVPPTSWCGQNGRTCTDVDQHCVPAAVLTAVGHCACIAPQTGASQAGAPAQCELDECVAACPTCADSGKGNVCEANGQTCVEGSRHPVAGLRDWQCVCPHSGVAAVAAVAKCSVNECDDAATRQVCLGAEQVCEDPNTDAEVTGDWYCECHRPWVGKTVGGAATCTYDECVVNGETCQAHGQTCMDPDVTATVTGDWRCVCPSPATGSATAKFAACVFVGDCDDAAVSAVCTSKGQTCFDPDTAASGDWECRCVAPQTGAAGAQAPAECVLDECAVACPTCALKPGSRTHACVSAEQTCVDLNTNAHSTGDWKCVCAPPKVGEQVGAAAECTVDECADANNKRVCEAATDTAGDAVQLCRDPDTATSGDWTCVCKTPYVGTAATREAASCTLDECSMKAQWAPSGQNGNDVCQAAGQVCVDPQQGVRARENWLCKCADGGDHVALKAPVAAGLCAPTVGLCAQHASACPSGQQCAEIADKWYCECIAPAVGRREAAGANCTLDECTARCSTCAQQGSVHACAAAEQACHDDDTRAASLNDWSCVCETGVGQARGQAATCLVDECALNGGVCTAANQYCTDPDKTIGSTGDWMCHCELPTTGSATAGTAECRYDECLEQAATCTAEGQECVDTNQAAARRGDWVCKCPPPSTGQETAGVAACDYKGGCEVEANRRVCSAVGQKCVSNADDAADWSCACIAPSIGPMSTQQVTVCAVDECLYICPTCARTSEDAAHVCRSAGQRCVDPNTSERSLGDWMCECPAPSTAAALGRPVETCEVDECVMVSQHGARKCEHFQRFTVQGCQCACPWRVETNAPGFDGPGFSEDCVQGCCNPNSDPRGDWCMVAATDYNRGIPECLALIATAPTTCADANVPRPPGAPARATLPAGSDALAVPNVCTVAGQVCVDKSPTVSSLGDWECRCPHSDGKKALAVADCEVDECMQPQPASANSKICTDAGQVCVDPDRRAESNWECRCTGSATGTMVGAPVAAGACTYEDGDECTTAANRETCADAGQYCFDPDTDSTGDWECRCAEPATGTPGRQGEATCLLDECVVQCTTCADKANGQGHACRSQGQTCRDPRPSAAETGDWECECAAPSTGSMVAAAAECTFDECSVAAKAAVCTQEGQTCVDPNKVESHDWECRCTTGEGRGVTRPARCVVDECLVPAKMNICAAAGQSVWAKLSRTYANEFLQHTTPHAVL